MSRNSETEERILKMRDHERGHLNLCNELYWHQVCAGRHFHLEQPQGSELMKQPEVSDIALGTMPASLTNVERADCDYPRMIDFSGREQ